MISIKSIAFIDGQSVTEGAERDLKNGALTQEHTVAGADRGAASLPREHAEHLGRESS
jgi:hypothetical protein